MKKLFIVLAALSCFATYGYSAQTALKTSVDASMDGSAGDSTGEDWRLTVFENWTEQEAMNTELYGWTGQDLSSDGNPSFTSVTAGEFISTAADGSRTSTLPENTTTHTPAAGAEEIWNQGGEIKVSEGGTAYDLLHSGDTIQSNVKVTSDADGINLTLADHNASVILMTGAGEVGAWDCSTANIGSWFEVWVRDASEQVQVVCYGDTSTDLFVLKNGAALDANDEVDLATTANKRYTFICLENNKWYIAAEDATSTDGGAAD